LGCGHGLRAHGMGLQLWSMQCMCCSRHLHVLYVVVAGAARGVTVMVIMPRMVYVATKGSDEAARRDMAMWCTQPGRVQRGGGHICIVVVVGNNRWVDLDNFLLNVALS
jgi:hypothetical protein